MYVNLEDALHAIRERGSGRGACASHLGVVRAGKGQGLAACDSEDQPSETQHPLAIVAEVDRGHGSSM
ncbi:hypothetical protein FIBSPDRAFT_177990 [Athelia psychrophila]|uniref:Uncharacterized protein n=1 Tax=Athelia psychrophila TaxID=1759441 RepID=A0A166SPK2_9AGAM|nr:hypothetical protein FIBSPDRAFT_177990 [Fibularhizoctonia sp. CBS 109695]